MKKLPTNLTPLIDGDWIVYMCCQAIEYSCEGEPKLQDIVDVFDHKIEEIVKTLGGTTEPPIIFYTGQANFRKERATTKVYKGNRKDKERPFHYENLKNYISTKYACLVNPATEADDMMAIWQTQWEECKPLDHEGECIIVTVDKDLRQVNGWHYSPEGHNFPSFGPTFVTDDNSYINLKNPVNPGKGLIGTGYKFFWSQVITGDSVDNIPGLPKAGPKFAYELLKDVDSEYACYEAVKGAYRDVLLNADDCLREQVDLLYMVRELDGGGYPVMYTYPEEVKDVCVSV